MAQDATGEYYTVAQAAKALGVSVSTIWRWIKANRLTAFRLGPKAIRVRRQDVDAELRLVSPAPPPRAQVVYKNASEIPPLTEEERVRARAAMDAMDELRREIRAGRKGRLMPDSVALIRRERERRSRQLL